MQSSEKSAPPSTVSTEIAEALRRVADRLDATVESEEQGGSYPSRAMIAACSRVSAALRTEADALTG